MISARLNAVPRRGGWLNSVPMVNFTELKVVNIPVTTNNPNEIFFLPTHLNYKQPTLTPTIRFLFIYFGKGCYDVRNRYDTWHPSRY